MATQIFVNLPVKDLNRSVAFFTALGYTFHPQFTDENATCMIVSEEHIYVMLLVDTYFQTFTSKTIVDAKTSTEVLLCLSCESRTQVDELVAKAVAAGGTTPAWRVTSRSTTASGPPLRASAMPASSNARRRSPCR